MQTDCGHLLATPLDSTAEHVLSLACDSLSCEDLEEPCDQEGSGLETFVYETFGLGLASFILILLMLVCCVGYCIAN